MGRKLVNVLQLISSLEVGGSEKLLVSFLSACRDNDEINFTVAIMNDQINEELLEELERLSIPVYQLNRPEGHLHPRYLWQLLRIIRRHHIDIIHAHNTGSKMWGALCKLLSPGVKMVFTIHDTCQIPRLGRLQIQMHKYLIDVNIAISKAVERLCHHRGIRNMQQIYNGIPLHRFANPQQTGLARRNEERSFENDPLRILHVGRMDTALKGQDILIEALRLCKENGLSVRARLMGGVYDYNRDAFEVLKAQVQAAGLSEEVEFLLNRSDVPEQLAWSDLFVLPSRKEGLGLAALEAMAAGVPVIVSNTGGLKELVENGKNGLLIEPGDPEDLFRKIRMAYKMPGMADRLGQHALAFVGQFDVHIMKQRYFGLYHALTGKPSVARPVRLLLPLEEIRHESPV